MECPIEENRTLRLFFDPAREAGELLLSACCDTIHIFPDERYTHVKVFDEGQIKTLFLSDDEYDEIASFGIPVVVRESITRNEHDAWLEYMGKVAVSNLDEELNELLGE